MLFEKSHWQQSLNIAALHSLAQFDNFTGDHHYTLWNNVPDKTNWLSSEQNSKMNQLIDIIKKE